MNENRSVATIDAPEFINLTPYNPLISQCEIKVLYLGKNRNGSYIDKNTAVQMANSLPGCPIVGAFREDIEDFGDHGHIMHIEDGEITFSVKTKPYGFVAPDAQVWFKKFTDTDDFGNEVEREYLMTTGYLWTGQYEEVQDVLTEGKGQSMELDEKTLQGKWAEDNNSGLSFFIINDAIFSKLCILGDDVEPCFEGASVTAPEVSKEFAVDPDFSRTLFSMLNELKDALKDEGGSNMNEDQLKVAEEGVDPNTSNDEFVEEVEEQEEVEPEFADDGDAGDTDAADTADEASDTAEADVADEEETEVAEPEEEPVATTVTTPTTTSLPEDEDEDDDSISDDDDNDETGSLIPRIHMTAEDQKELDDLRAEIKELREFKARIESSQKDALIKKYYMLSDEDKAEVIEHKNEYSLDEIESKLALIYVQKNVDFEVEETEKSEELEGLLTFNLDSDEDAGSCSGILAALRETVHE